MLEYYARVNQKLIVTRRQMEIIVGGLLGDGYIHPRGQIQFHQTIKQSEYLEWKYQELKSLAYGPPKKVERFDPRYQKTYLGERFWLRQYFRPLRGIFYPKGKKVFPLKMTGYLTGLAMAVWYMDDGNLYKNRNVKIAADGFDNADRVKLQKILFEKFAINTSIQSSGKLRISAGSLERFFGLITPHLHASMRYKVP